MGSSKKQHADVKKDFEELYNQNFARVNRYLRYRVINTWDADDLTTLVFVKALEKFETFRGESSFSSWVLCIAHNVYVDYIRKSREVATPDERMYQQEAVDGIPEEQMLLNEEVEELRALMNELPLDYRDVMALRYAGELRFKQIGEVLGKTEVAVRMIHHRAVKILRGNMKKYG